MMRDALAPRVAIGAALPPDISPVVRVVPRDVSPLNRPRTLLLSLEAPDLLLVELVAEPIAIASLYLQLQFASRRGRRAACAGFLTGAAEQTPASLSWRHRELLAAVGAALEPELAVVARAIVRGRRCYGKGLAAVRGRIVSTASAGVGSGRRWRPLLLREA